MKASSGSGLCPTRISWCDMARRPASQRGCVSHRYRPGRGANASAAGPEYTTRPLLQNVRRCRRPSAHRRQVVRHDHHRGLELLVVGQVVDHAHHLGGHLRVEGAGRFVEQDRRGVNRKSAGDRNTLLLPAGKLAGLASSLLGQSPTRSSSFLAIASASTARFPERVDRPAHHVLSAVMCGNRLNCWNTMPTVRRSLQQRVLRRRPAAAASSFKYRRPRSRLPETAPAR